MSERAWMPLYIGDYNADTGHLNVAEHGAYLMLIMHYWQHGGLPADERMIARVSRMSAEQWAESRDVLAMLFSEGWRHKRIDAELARAADIIAKRKNAANIKHGKSKPDANDVHVQSTCNADAPTRAGTPITKNLSDTSVSDDTRVTPRACLESVLDYERSQAVLDHRQRIRKPLTAHAAKLLAAELAKAPDPNVAADEMIAAGWSGFKVSWLQNRTSPRQGTGPPRKSDPVDDLQAYLEMKDARERREGEGNHKVVELLPPNRAKQDALAGHIRAAARSGFD